MRRALALIVSDSPGGDRVVTVRGEIDVGNAPALRDWLARASVGGRRSVLVDFRAVDFLAVSGLYVLCDEAQRMARHRARLTVVCTNPRALQLFRVCQLDDALDVVASRDDASSEPWCGKDDARAARLTEWLQRYSAESA